MYKILLSILLFGFCFAQDSTSIEQKLGEVGEMRIDEQMEYLKDLRLQVQNTIIMANSQIETSQEDLGRIDYAEFILKQVLDPPEKKTDSMMMPHKPPPKDKDVEAENDNIMNETN